MYPTINDETDRLAAVARIDKEEAVRMARAHELQPCEGSLAERIKPRQDAFAAWPKTGPKADEAFYDALSGEP